ncbi:peptidoglycan DD-metalloendopeptidase family protein [Micrococcus luteus]|uniref:peptidoglycan DD-metalloendopeptidase family protein n=1 Tax=Micrococcus luteus TaxID=1270 RepID=UPI001E519564|nr:M23 family metallopeptidase [Micrococcus luteus]MCD0182450.1 M23 family metallopeptidase [Micrococcus luteus]
MKRAGLALVVLFLLILGAALVMLPFVAAASFQASKTTQTGGGIAEICAAGEAGQAQIPEEYREDVAKAAQVSGFSQEVIASQIFQESRWDPTVTSPSGARGLGQFKDDTWPTFGEGGDPYNGHDSIAAQGRFLKWLKDQYRHLAKGDDELLVRMVLSGYRLGHNTVLEVGGLPDAPEATAYHTEILARTAIYTTECKPVMGGDDVVVAGDWTHPLPGSYFTSPYGWRDCVSGVGCSDVIRNHNGIDFANPDGSPGTVVAATAMTVTQINLDADSGVFVRGKQQDDPGYILTYLHCAEGSVRVAVGDSVPAGKALCTEGATGLAEKHHLHFMINMPDSPGGMFEQSRTVDPRPILEANGVAACPPGRDVTDACAS